MGTRVSSNYPTIVESPRLLVSDSLSTFLATFSISFTFFFKSFLSTFQPVVLLNISKLYILSVLLHLLSLSIFLFLSRNSHNLSLFLSRKLYPSGQILILSICSLNLFCSVLSQFSVPRSPNTASGAISELCIGADLDGLLRSHGEPFGVFFLFNFFLLLLLTLG